MRWPLVYICISSPASFCFVFSLIYLYAKCEPNKEDKSDDIK